MSISAIGQGAEQEALIRAVRENLKNDYHQDSVPIALDIGIVERVCSIFKDIIFLPIQEQLGRYRAALFDKQLAQLLEYGRTRLRKYSSEVELDERLSDYSEDARSQMAELGRLTKELGAPDRLIFNNDFRVERKEVCFEKGTYLGDGRTRVISRYPLDPRLVELSYSIWVAESFRPNQYIWRARVLVDNQDVYKLLKFLTEPKGPGTCQSIHINTGCHSFGGKGPHTMRAIDLRIAKELPDRNIAVETLMNICLLNLNPFQKQNISIHEVGTQAPAIYPESANHIVDTLCEGAKVMVSGERSGLQTPLQFLSPPPAIPQKVEEARTDSVDEKVGFEQRAHPVHGRHQHRGHGGRHQHRGHGGRHPHGGYEGRGQREWGRHRHGCPKSDT